MLRIQQGVWHAKRRAVIVFEGVDAAGKGGAIRELTEDLDPRGLRVHAVGPPTPEEQGRHYLYRFWRNLPKPGTIAIFDRSWYGRVFVERVEKLTPENRLQDAYAEINQFEAMLQADGIDLVKIFLAIHPDEQLKRFESRLKDPYKQWKLSKEDLEARKKWKSYIRAYDEAFCRTDKKQARWHLVMADSKDYARFQVLKIVTKELFQHQEWMEKQVRKKEHKELARILGKLKKIR